MENDPIKCGGFQLQAATHPHPFSSLESISVELKCFCGRQLSVVLDMAGQGSVILCHQCWALVAYSPLDAVLYIMAVYLGFMFFLCFQVSKWKHCCLFFSNVMGKKKKNKGVFLRREEKEMEQLLKLRFPCPKPTNFLQCQKINLSKRTSVQLVSG